MITIPSANVSSLTDDTIKGILRSLGDTGDTPVNTTGHSHLAHLSTIAANVILNKHQLEDINERSGGSLGTAVDKQGNQSNGTNVIHTVTGGKDFVFLSGALIGKSEAGGGGTVEMQVRNDSDVMQWSVQFVLLASQVLVVPLSFISGRSITAAWDVALVSSAANITGFLDIHGYEV